MKRRSHKDRKDQGFWLPGIAYLYPRLSFVVNYLTLSCTAFTGQCQNSSNNKSILKSWDQAQGLTPARQVLYQWTICSPVNNKVLMSLILFQPLFKNFQSFVNFIFCSFFQNIKERTTCDWSKADMYVVYNSNSNWSSRANMSVRGPILKAKIQLLA